MTRTNPDMTRTNPDNPTRSGLGSNPDTDSSSPRRGELTCPGQNPRIKDERNTQKTEAAKESGLKAEPVHVDFDAIARQADLPKMLEAEGFTLRKRMTFCPFHKNERTAALSLYEKDKRWKFNCFGCGVGGDAIDWRSMRDGISRLEAACILGGLPFDKDEKSGAKPVAVVRAASLKQPDPTIETWQEPEWQEAVNALVASCERTLWSKAGSKALDWLRARGLEDHTIRKFRLGFNAEPFWTSHLGCVRDEHNRPRGLFLFRGITIPWPAPGSSYTHDPRWVGLNVRRLAAQVLDPLPDNADKCRCIKGSSRGFLYPFPDVLPTQGHLPALLVEGEFDALIGWQEAGWMVHAVTVGGANQEPQESALAGLVRCPWWLLAFDRDEAGIEAAHAWKDRAPHKARRMILPHGKDLNDFVKAGGGVPAWLRAEGARITANHQLAEVAT